MLQLGFIPLIVLIPLLIAAGSAGFLYHRLGVRVADRLDEASKPQPNTIVRNKTVAGATAAVLLAMTAGGVILAVPNPINGRRVHEAAVAQDLAAATVITAATEDSGLEPASEEATDRSGRLGRVERDLQRKGDRVTTLSEDVQAIRDLLARIPVDVVEGRTPGEVVVVGLPEGKVPAGKAPEPPRVGELAASSAFDLQMGQEPGASDTVRQRLDR